MIPPKHVSREEAKAAGLRYFFTGLPCRNSHIAERRVGNGECVRCRALADERRLEKIKAYHRSRYRAKKKRWQEYSAKNRGRLNMMRRRRVALDRKRINEVTRRWRDRNRDRLNEIARKQYWKNRKAIRKRQAAYTRAHSVEARQRARARRQAMRFMKPDYSTTDVKDLLEKQGGNCAICFSRIRGGFHIDHIQPISRGGQDVLANIQITHPRCNIRKKAKDPIQFAQELGRLL